MPTDAQLRLEGAYKVVEWMEIRNREGCGTYDAKGLKCDLDHSALLHWLCNGNQPLPERPPVRFSRPDHRAARDGHFKPVEVATWTGSDYLIVDQEVWLRLYEIAPEVWTAAYKTGTNSDGTVKWSSPWRIAREAKIWRAERLP